jgi:hypothetical protein
VEAGVGVRRRGRVSSRRVATVRSLLTLLPRYTSSCLRFALCPCVMLAGGAPLGTSSERRQHPSATAGALKPPFPLV